LFAHVLHGLRLIELDTLGGSGSRGYGKVSFGEVTITDLNSQEKKIKVVDVPTDDIKFNEWVKKNFPVASNPSGNKEPL
jgi:CRISPR/Cas system CSM-associated protein Csm3 (group 7 of RAMP superfamily)